MCFRVGVTETDGDSYYSENRCIRVVEHFADADVNTAVELANSANDIYDQAINEGKTYQEAAEIVVNQLKSHPDIAGIIATDVGGVSWITTVGILGGYHPVKYDQQEAEVSGVFTATSIDNNQVNALKAIESLSKNDPKNIIQSNKAIIISPYIKNVPPSIYGDFGQNDNYYTAWLKTIEKNSSRMYAAEERINDNDPAWNLDKFKNLSDYGVIIICTHGFLYNMIVNEWSTNVLDYDYFTGPAQVALYTALRIPKKSDGTYDITGYEKDLHQRRIAIQTDGTIAILPNFIRHYIADLPNSLVVLSACYSGYNESMAAAFWQSGARAVVGHAALANPRTTGMTVKFIAEELYNDKTVQEGVNKAKIEIQKVSRAHFIPDIERFGNADLKLPEDLYEDLDYEGKWTNTTSGGSTGGGDCKLYLYENGNASYNYGPEGKSYFNTVFGKHENGSFTIEFPSGFKIKGTYNTDSFSGSGSNPNASWTTWGERLK